MAQELKLTQKIGLRLTQQQLRFVKLLELNAPELDEEVEKELESNPALEQAESPEGTRRGDDDPTPYDLRDGGWSGSQREDTSDYVLPDDSANLYDVLTAQVAERNLRPQVAAMAEYIIGNLDSNGWLNRPLGLMINDLAFNAGVEVEEATAREALDVVRDLEPAGVGAENLRDCLLLQLNRLAPDEERDDAIRIVEEQFDALAKHHSHKIISGLRLSKERVDAAVALIRKLNPKPGASVGGGVEKSSGIVPDFVVSQDSGELYISLNNRIPELAISESYSEAMRGIERRRGRPRKGTEFVSSRYNEARDFINVLTQRQQTMLTVMTAILSCQRDYFESGDVYLMKPMMLKDIRRITGLDESVISRATKNKYVAMPWGEVLSLKSFFSDTVAEASEGEGAGEGDVLTNRKIEATIRRMVDEEDKRRPLSDEKIREKLAALGYDISRRTIAKYRDRQGILVARLRREL